MPFIKFSILSLFFLVGSILYAQKIKLNHKIVKVDHEKTFTYRNELNGSTFTNLNGEDLFYVSFHPRTDLSPAYTKLIFLKEKKIMTNHTLVLTRKNLIKSLLQNNVYHNGVLDQEALALFILKFHEDIPSLQKIVIENHTLIQNQEMP